MITNNNNEYEQNYGKNHSFDPLTEFHLHNHDRNVYALLDAVVQSLKQVKKIHQIHQSHHAYQANNNQLEAIIMGLQQQLGDAECERILQFICSKTGNDYAALSQHVEAKDYATNQGHTNCSVGANLPAQLNQANGEHTTAKLILHVLFLSSCYQDIHNVALILNTDVEETAKILEYLKRVFTIDEPLIWLENFLLQTKKEREYSEQCYVKLFHGEAIVNQPVDTAEERRIKSRKNQFLHKD